MTNNDDRTPMMTPWTPPQVSDFDIEGWECKECIRADMLGKRLPHIHIFDEENNAMQVLDNKG